MATLRRPYSIAVGPAEAARDHALEFLIGLGPDGAPGPHLPDLSPGTPRRHRRAIRLLRVSRNAATNRTSCSSPAAPASRRCAPCGIRRSGGDPAWRIGVVYSARTPDEFAFDDELTALSSSGRLTYVPHRDEARRRALGRRARAASIGRLLEAALVSRETLCFVCGPEALVHDVPGMLREIGIATERIRVEEWAVQSPMMW